VEEPRRLVRKRIVVRHVGVVAADVGDGRRVSLPLEARGVLMTK
jgi:hypothetical protein